MNLSARLAALELALGASTEAAPGIYLADADGVVRDGSGGVLQLPAPVPGGPLAVVLRRGPEPAAPRVITLDEA